MSRSPGAFLLTLALIGCTVGGDATPTPPPPVAPRAVATAAPPVPALARGVTVVGSDLVASGDFKGNGRSQIALLRDARKDSELRVTVLEAGADGQPFAESEWLATGPAKFGLHLAKFAVADVTFDGRDDLIALYNDGGLGVRLLVFASTGTAFTQSAEPWWRSTSYAWSRAINLLGGDFSGSGRAGLAITYQYDNERMRIHSFQSTGTAFTFGGDAGIFDSGAVKYDLFNARVVAGRFTRSAGATQIAALYQYPNLRVRLHVFEPTPAGLSLINGYTGVYESRDNEFELARAAIAAVDATGDGRDDVVAVYGGAQGGAIVHVFDSARSFQPVNGWGGVATLPARSICTAVTGLVAGDWNADGRGDAAALVPGLDGGRPRLAVLRGAAGSFTPSTSVDPMRCDRWPLTGLPSTGDVGRRPLYVKIDNNPSARPHYGLSRADQVYEWLVEGLTTRLAAVFHSMEPGEIGSVRSARMTDAPILPSLKGAMAYSGGASEELMRMSYDESVRRYIDLSPQYGWGYRVPFRPSPYNFFTNYARLTEALTSIPEGSRPVDVPGWSFLPTATGDPLSGGFGASVPVPALTIPYRAGFAVRYTYEPAARTYARFQEGVREMDAANREVIAVRNIVTIRTDVRFTTEWGLDAAGSPKLDMRLTGTGPGALFRDGRRQEVTWVRADIADPYTFRTAAGEPVLLAPGQTWIHIVPSDWTIPNS